MKKKKSVAKRLMAAIVIARSGRQKPSYGTGPLRTFHDSEFLGFRNGVAEDFVLLGYGVESRCN